MDWERELNIIRGKNQVGGATQEDVETLFSYIGILVKQLDKEDLEDWHGTEGWRHYFGVEAGVRGAGTGGRCMNDTDARAIVGSIEIKRCEGGYGHFDVRTGKRIGRGQIFLTHLDALRAAKKLSAQEES